MYGDHQVILIQHNLAQTFQASLYEDLAEKITQNKGPIFLTFLSCEMESRAVPII